MSRKKPTGDRPISVQVSYKSANPQSVKNEKYISVEEHEKELDSLLRKTETLVSRLTGEYKKTLSYQDQEYSKTINLLKQKHSLILSDVRSQYDKRIPEITRQYQELLELQKQEHLKTLNSIQGAPDRRKSIKLENEINMLKGFLDESNNTQLYHDKILNEKINEIKSLKHEISVLVRDIEALGKRNQEYKDEVFDLKYEIKSDRDAEYWKNEYMGVKKKLEVLTVQSELMRQNEKRSVVSNVVERKKVKTSSDLLLEKVQERLRMKKEKVKRVKVEKKVNESLKKKRIEVKKVKPIRNVEVRKVRMVISTSDNEEDKTKRKIANELKVDIDGIKRKRKIVPKAKFRKQRKNSFRSDEKRENNENNMKKEEMKKIDKPQSYFSSFRTTSVYYKKK